MCACTEAASLTPICCSIQKEKKCLTNRNTFVIKVTVFAVYCC